MIATGTELSSKRSVAYGIGGTAAICAPLVASMDARARTLLGSRKDVNRAVTQYYIPWLEAIQSSQDGSLFDAMTKTATKLSHEMLDLGSSEPAALQQNISGGLLQRILGLDPGAMPISERVGCGYYEQTTHIDYGLGGITHGPGHPGTGVTTLKTAPGSAVAWTLTAENSFYDLDNAALKGVSPGPTLSLKASWTNAPSAVGCSRFLAQGEDPSLTAPQQQNALINSDQAKTWDKSLSDFSSGPLANLNDDRRSMYALNILLEAARGATNLLKKVTTTDL